MGGVDSLKMVLKSFLGLNICVGAKFSILEIYEYMKGFKGPRIQGFEGLKEKIYLPKIRPAIQVKVIR